MKKCLLIIGLTISSIVSMQAQEPRKLFEEFKQKATKEYGDFRTKANAEYADFMEKAWTMYELMDAEEIPVQPKPVLMLENEAPVTNSKIEYDMVEESPFHRQPKLLGEVSGVEHVLAAQPEPLEEIVSTLGDDALEQSLILYGSNIPVRVATESPKPIKLRNLSEKSVAKMWRNLSCPYYDNVVAECLRQRKAYNLCDWAYVKLTETMANKYFGQGTNESVVLQMYLLVQSGYQMRIAMAGKELTLLIGSKEKIYGYKYTIMDGIQYYPIDKSMQYKSMQVFDRAFPNEKLLSLELVQPKLGVNKTGVRKVIAADYPEIEIEVETNKNLIDFYNEYPICGKWDYYCHASLSDVLKKSLYPTLQSAIAGKTEFEAVNILLDFVQTGLKYSSDLDQFGYERPLYPDEVLFYPYCDCEDRSIFFSCLVRELLGLDVALLSYPGHVTTAVRFNERVEGDYLTINDERYVICEPTFTKGQPAGRSGSEFKNKKPNVLKL